MTINAYFSDIRDIILRDIRNASKSISIAVAWFTNHEIFDELIKKLNQGIRVQLIILNDDINLSGQSLDFQRFVDSKGSLWIASAEHPMHHKFCIIDDSILITGSYNYTYLADRINHENVVRFEGVSDIIAEFQEEFQSLSSETKVQDISKYLSNNPPKVNYYSFRNFRINDIYECASELSRKGDTKRATEMISRLETEAEAENPDSSDFEIIDVVYNHWQEDYYADKITVTSSKIIVSFRTENVSSGWSIQGVGAPCSWVIEDVETKKVIHASLISNVRVNGAQVVEKLQRNTIYAFGKENKSVSEELGLTKLEDNLYCDSNGKEIRLITIDQDASGTMTVDITFQKAKNWENKTINFLEGIETRNLENYWHCLAINLKLNRCPISSSKLES